MDKGLPRSPAVGSRVERPQLLPAVYPRGDPNLPGGSLDTARPLLLAPSQSVPHYLGSHGARTTRPWPPVRPYSGPSRSSWSPTELGGTRGVLGPLYVCVRSCEMGVALPHARSRSPAHRAWGAGP